MSRPSYWPVTGSPGTCRVMDTRRCPPDNCADLPCARFEVTMDEARERWQPVLPADGESLRNAVRTEPDPVDTFLVGCGDDSIALDCPESGCSWGNYGEPTRTLGELRERARAHLAEKHPDRLLHRMT